MVLKVAQALADKFFPYQYAYHILIALISIRALRAFSQGRTTDRERDLHNRTFLVTGGLSPLGLTLLQNLAQRGAKIIILSPYSIDSPTVDILVRLLRTTYNNEDIYAEQCDLSEPSSIRNFCMRFLTEGEMVTPESKPGNTKSTGEHPNPKTGTDSRLDGLIFAHEYQHIGVPRFLRSKSSTKMTSQEQDEMERESNSLATFLVTTLLLPALLVAPVERDIRIINVVNPFYAAASAHVRTSKTFDPTFTHLVPTPPPSSSISQSQSTPQIPRSIFLTEGLRSLRTIIFTRHLQRVFDALPKPQIPKAEEGSSSVPIISARVQRSNIVAVSVSPGLGRVGTVSRLLNADWSLSETVGQQEGIMTRSFSWIGVFFYILLLPLLHLSTKSPKAAIQSVLHALFLPTPFKVLSQSISATSDPEPSKPQQNEQESTTKPPPPKKPSSLLTREEVLKPGALYAECAVVNLNLTIPSPPPSSTESAETEKTQQQDTAKTRGKAKSKGLEEEVLQIDDDGEYGGEIAGRMVWEAYELALKVWDKDGGRDRKEPANRKDS